MTARPAEAAPRARAAAAAVRAIPAADLEAFCVRFPRRNNATPGQLLEALVDSGQMEPLIRTFPLNWYRGIHASLTERGETPADATELIKAVTTVLAAARRTCPPAPEVRRLTLLAAMEAEPR